MNSVIKSLFAVLLLLILFFVSLLYANSIEPTEFCEGKNDCLIELIEETQDSSLCRTSGDKETCYLLAAEELKDPALCLKSDKIEQCLFDLAIELERPSLCDSSTNQTYCYYSYALSENDETYCQLAGEYSETCLKRLIKE